MHHRRLDPNDASMGGLHHLVLPDKTLGTARRANPQHIHSCMRSIIRGDTYDYHSLNVLLLTVTNLTACSKVNFNLT